MDVTFPTEAIILDRSYFREYDSRVMVYSREYGKMDLVVRGTRRPKSKLAGHVEPISQAALMIVKGKQYDYVGSARGINSFSFLKDNLDQLVNSGKVIKMVKRMVEFGEPDHQLYDLLRDYLLCINDRSLSQEKGDLLYCVFILKFITQLGYGPQLDVCVKCEGDNDRDFYFNYKIGGLICGNCAKEENNNLFISKKAIGFLRTVSMNDSNAYDKACEEKLVNEVKNILRFYVKYQLDFDI